MRKKLLGLSRASGLHPGGKTAVQRLYPSKPRLQEIERSTCARCLVRSRAVCNYLSAHGQLIHTGLKIVRGYAKIPLYPYVSSLIGPF